MQTASIQWIGEEKFVATSPSGHAITIDSERTSNKAPGPMELVLMALGACTATDVVSILDQTRNPLSPAWRARRSRREARHRAQRTKILLRVRHAPKDRHAHLASRNSPAGEMTTLSQITSRSSPPPRHYRISLVPTLSPCNLASASHR